MDGDLLELPEIRVLELLELLEVQVPELLNAQIFELLEILEIQVLELLKAQVFKLLMILAVKDFGVSIVTILRVATSRFYRDVPILAHFSRIRARPSSGSPCPDFME